MRSVNAGVIGLGIGEQHALGYARASGCRLVGLCDRSRQKLNQVSVVRFTKFKKEQLGIGKQNLGFLLSCFHVLWVCYFLIPLLLKIQNPLLDKQKYYLLNNYAYHSLYISAQWLCSHSFLSLICQNP